MKEKRKAFDRSFLYRAILFLLLELCALFLLFYATWQKFVRVDFEEKLKEAVQERMVSDYYVIDNYYQQAKGKEAEKYSRNRNIRYKLVSKDGDSVLGSTYNGFTTDYTLTVKGVKIGFKWYDYYFYVDSNFLIRDEYRQLYDFYMETDSRRNFMKRYEAEIRFLAVGAVLAAIGCCIGLCRLAGRRKGKEEIVPGFFNRIYVDVLTALLGGILWLGAKEVLPFNNSKQMETFFILLVVYVVLAVFLLTMYLTDFAVRVKMGKWWRHTLLYHILRFFIFCGKSLWDICIRTIRRIPLVPATAIVYLLWVLAEGVGIRIGLLENNRWIYGLWIAEKGILFPLVICCAAWCKKLLQAGEALASGDLNYKLDTEHLLFDFKRLGNYLNHIGEGMTKAVEERMKSEHLKTELITNVSHDLKTPLTSIINYADLLGNSTMEPEQIKEYSEVLLRQSNRLKKLLDDLMEAAKANTGNLEVVLEKCEIGVMLTQAAGEYEKRFSDLHLTLIAKQCEEPVYILADGKHLWRIFDNLLNNICKYGQENSRVYLTLEQQEGQAVVIFRNMSKYALEVPGEELTERFVRGDKSRHLEGNGLGLSIAESLAQLQHGKMEIVTDGDLFKVILRFPVLEVSEEGRAGTNTTPA